MKTVTLQFADIATRAGYLLGPDGKLNLPVAQFTAVALASAAVDLLGPWSPGDEPVEVILTGPGPIWGYLMIAHALHGRAAKLTYAAPNATIVIYAHGV